MYEVWAIHLELKQTNGQTKAGWLANGTTVTPEFNVKYTIFENKYDEIFLSELIFVLSINYGNYIMEKVRERINFKYNNPDITLNLVKFEVKQKDLETIIDNRWKYETA